MMPFILKRTNCCMPSSSSGAGQMLTLEVLLHASSVVVLSSESATPVTMSVNDGVHSAAAFGDREELARVEKRIWGGNPDAL